MQGNLQDCGREILVFCDKYNMITYIVRKCEIVFLKHIVLKVIVFPLKIKEGREKYYTPQNRTKF